MASISSCSSHGVALAGQAAQNPLSESAQKFLENVFIYGDGKPKTLEEWQGIRKMFWDGAIVESQQAKELYIEKTEKTTLGGIPVSVSTPKNFIPANADKVIVYIHGGAFTLGSSEHMCQVFAQVAHETGCKVVAIDYPLAPEAPFPAGLNACFTVYKTLLEQYYPAPNIAFVGDSAGGTLCVGVALKAKAERLLQPGALALFSPLANAKKGASYVENRDPHIDYEQTIAPSLEAYASREELDGPYVTLLNADLTGLAPMIAQTGSRDALESDSKGLIQLAKSQGVDATLHSMPGIWHGVVERMGIPEADRARHVIAEFIKAKLDLAI